MGEGKREGADGQIYEIVAAVRVGLLGAREFRLVPYDRHHRFRQNPASLVGDCTRDAAECLLSVSVRGEAKRSTQG